MKEIKEIIIGDYQYLVIGVSVIGKKKIENQDFFLLSSDKASLTITVADGLGSAPFSKEGAIKICNLCQNMLSSNVDNNAILELKEKWKESVKSDFDKYDTTIKFLKISGDEVLFGGVGDGWICLSSEKDTMSLEAPHTFSNQTDSILSIDLLSKFSIKRVSITGEFVGLISTDGFSEDIDKKNAAEFLNEIKTNASNDINGFAEEMENSLKNWPVETNCDDKTVVFIVRKEISK